MQNKVTNAKPYDTNVTQEALNQTQHSIRSAMYCRYVSSRQKACYHGPQTGCLPLKWDELWVTEHGVAIK